MSTAAVTALRTKLAERVAAQTTELLLASLAQLEEGCYSNETPETEEKLIARIAIEREIESRFTPAQDDIYSALVDDWERTIDWTQVEMYSLVLAAA